MNMQLHVAFAMSLPDVLAAPDRLAAQGIQPLSFFGQAADEASVIGWMPAAAVYFRDPDGHMLEYLAMLEGPAQPSLGIVPWSVFAQSELGETLDARVRASHGEKPPGVAEHGIFDASDRG
jgi:lactoylglutathione lyase